MDNTIRFQNKAYDDLIAKMRSNVDQNRTQKFCREALNILYQQHVLIPQGEYAIGRIMKTDFKGLHFTFNGTIDLTFIHNVSN
jgi:ABC-type transport system substrate-binding protein